MVSASFLKECDIFSRLNDARLKELVAIARQEQHDPGTLLYKIGDRSTCLYLVEKGKVALEMKSDMGPTRPPMSVTVDQVNPLEAFGWSAFDEPNLHTLNATVAEPTTLIAFDGEKLKGLMSRDPQMGMEIIRGLTRQLASCLKESRLLLMSERALAFLTSGTEYA